jgi:pSer/pThr/pTyr-binding forkhead associated (FHA) protein
MSDPKLSRLEAQLEHLIEGAFAQLFSKAIRPQDIAVQLSRAMESNLAAGEDNDFRPVAPDDYMIRMNPDVHEHLLTRQPLLASILSQHIVDLVTHSGYRLNHRPAIRIVGDEQLTPSEMTIHAEHIDSQKSATAVMERIELPSNNQFSPANAQIIVGGQQVIPLTAPLVNIGRSRENDIVLNDPYVSRHHAQLRLRFGFYTLFDTSSQSGTLVNDVVVREHRLQPGDVIQIGKTRMVYLEDRPSDSQTGASTSLFL